MCGVPYHAVEGYIGKLLRAGLKVAMCDQVEDPATAKGLVKREVTRVVTPGTVSEPGLLDGKEENLLVALAFDGGRGAGAFLDVSTGAFFVRRWNTTRRGARGFAVLRPREALSDEGGLPAEVAAWIAERGLAHTVATVDRALDATPAAEILRRQFGVATLRGFGLEDTEPGVRAAAAALRYAQETQTLGARSRARPGGARTKRDGGARSDDARQPRGLPEPARGWTARQPAGGARSHG